jgi:hypothetical protein
MAATSTAESDLATTQAATHARVLFRQPVTGEGFLDAGWWPRSRDLAFELPSLLDVLWTAGRDVMRASYALDFWDPAPRRLRVAGHVVRLGGFHTQIPGLLTLIDPWGDDRIDVLVIPPDTEPAVADRALAIVAGEPSRAHPDQVLQRARDEIATGLPDNGRGADSNARTQEWETEGGQLGAAMAHR